MGSTLEPTLANLYNKTSSLVVSITRMNNKLVTSLYRKKTFSRVYMNYNHFLSLKKVFLEIWWQNSQENTCASASFLIKLQACNFIKKEALALVFSCEFCETSKNTFSYRTPQVAASKIPWFLDSWLVLTDLQFLRNFSTYIYIYIYILYISALYVRPYLTAKLSNQN